MSGRRLRDLVMAFLGLAALAFAFRVLAMHWRGVEDVVATLDPRWGGILLSAATVLLCYAVLIATWRHMVRTWGSALPPRDAAFIWFVSNLGRYLPGKVWQIGAMGMLAQRGGVAPDAAVGSSLVLAIVNLLAGFAVIAGGGVEALAVIGVSRGSAVAATGLAIVATLALPWMLPSVVRAVNRLSGRSLLVPQVPLAAIVVAFVGCTLAWIGYGFAFAVLSAALVELPSSATLAAHVVAFTLSYLAGYLAVFAPGGIGVRELALAALLTAWLGYGSGEAGVLVLASRLWLTVLEVLPGAGLLAGAALSKLPTRPS